MEVRCSLPALGDCFEQQKQFSFIHFAVHFHKLKQEILIRSPLLQVQILNRQHQKTKNIKIQNNDKKKYKFKASEIRIAM